MRTQLAGTLISSLVSPWAKNTAKMHQIPKLWRQGDNKFVFFSAAKFEVICSTAIYYKFREFVLFSQLTRAIITASTFFFQLEAIVYHTTQNLGWWIHLLKHVILCSQMDSGFSLLPESRVPLITSVVLEGELTCSWQGIVVHLLKCISGELGWETSIGWHTGEYDTCRFLRCLRDVIILRTMDWDDWHNRCIRKKKIEALKVISHQYSTKNENQRTSLTTIRDVSSLAA